MDPDASEVPTDAVASGAHAAPRPAEMRADAPFHNDPIDVEGLPRLDAGAFVPLDPRYARLSTMIGAVQVIVVCLIGAIVWVALDRPVAMAVAAGVAVLVGLGATIGVLGIRRSSYQVRTHDISVRRGLLTRTTSTVPFSRVQHVRIVRGPLNRSVGLAVLLVNSAGRDLAIPGLDDEDAARIRALVIERAGVDLDEETDDAAAAADLTPDPMASLPAPPTPPDAPTPPARPPVAPPGPPDPDLRR